MKASKFCSFFGYTIRRNEGFTEDGELYRYEVVDNDGTFATRYVRNVTELTDQFDQCLQNYVDDTLQEYGFMPDDNSSDGFYTQALKFINDGKGADLKGTDTHMIIECLCNPLKIEDDITGDNRENVKGFVFDYFADMVTYADNAITALCAQENMTLKEIIETIISVADTDSIGEKESVMELYATLYQQLYIVCYEDFLSGMHEMLAQAKLYENEENKTGIKFVITE